MCLRLLYECLMCSKCHEEEVECSRNVRNQCHCDLVGTAWVIRVSTGSKLGHTWVGCGSRGHPGSCCMGQVGHMGCVGHWASKTKFKCIWGYWNFGQVLWATGHLKWLSRSVGLVGSHTIGPTELIVPL